MMNTLEMMNIIKEHQATCPVYVIPIAMALGLNVYKAKDWPINLSGKLQKDNDKDSESGYSIYANANHMDKRRRFTIAHEIAHFILHRHLIKGNVLVDDAFYRSGLSNTVEASANTFAIDMLIPWHLINEKINSGINSVSELAEAFNVTNSSMSIRFGVPFET